MKNEWRYTEQPLKERMKKNTVTSIVFFILTFPLMFVITPMILKYVGKEMYGVWALVTAMVVFMELAGGLQTPSGISIMVPKYDPKKSSRDINEITNTVFFFYLLTAFLMSAAFFILKEPIMNAFFKVAAENSGDAYFVVAFTVYAFMLNFVLLAFVYLINAFNVVYITNIVHIIIAYIRTAAMAAALIMGYGIKGVAVAQMSCLILETVVLLCYVKKVYPPLAFGVNYISIKKFRELMSISLKLVMSKVSVLTGQNADKLILGYFINPVYAAYYQVGASVSKFIWQLPEIMGLSSILPAASELKSKDKSGNIHDMFVKVTRYLFFASILLCAGIIAFGNEFIVLWLGTGYEEAFLVMAVLAFAYTASLIGYPAMNILNGMERVKEVMWVSGLSALLNIVLSIVLTKYFGLKGTLISAAISLSIGGLALYILYRVISGKAGGILLSIIKPGAAAVISLGVISIMEYLMGNRTGWLLFFAKAGLFSVIYSAVCIKLFKVFDDNDMELIKGVFKLKKA